MNSEVVKLMDNYEFCNKLTKAESKDEVKQLFKQYGADISSEEIDSLETFMSSVASELEKLDIEQLKAISGGVNKGKKDTKDTDDKQSMWTLDSAGKVLDLLKAPATGFLDWWSKEKQSNRKADIEKVRIHEEASSKRNDKAMNTLVGTAVIAAIAGSICYFGKPIKKWWKGRH